MTIRRGNLAMEPDEPEDQPDSLEARREQIEDARRELARPLEEYGRWPYNSLFEMMGRSAPGELCIVTAFSGGGKTLFTNNFVHDTLVQQEPVYYLGLETKPSLSLLHFACIKLGYYVGDVISGAAKLRPDWPDMERALRAEIGAGYRDSYPLIINRERWLDLPRLTKAMQEAAFYGARWVVIDHMDHLATPEHTSLYQASVQTTRRLVEMAQEYGLRVLALSQLNNEAVRGDVLARHMPPRPEMVYMGGHKRQVATTMLGIYRPLDPDVSPEDLKAARAGKLDVQKVIQPHVMAIALMKHRHYGNREGSIVKLGVEHGRLYDLNQRV